MSPFPTDMTDRWRDRPEPSPGRGTYYWHMLLGDRPEARTIAAEAQRRLARFPGLHFTPVRRLHMTTLVAGSTDDISPGQAHAAIAEAARLLAAVPPIPVTLGRVLYHPQVIMLGVEPGERLRPIHEAAQVATHAGTGRPGRHDVSGPWTPHVTIAYSTADQPAAPLIEALGRRLPSVEIVITSLSLVVQHGPERLWNWQHIGSAYLKDA